VWEKATSPRSKVEGGGGHGQSLRALQGRGIRRVQGQAIEIETLKRAAVILFLLLACLAERGSAQVLLSGDSGLAFAGLSTNTISGAAVSVNGNFLWLLLTQTTTNAGASGQFIYVFQRSFDGGVTWVTRSDPVATTIPVFNQPVGITTNFVTYAKLDIKGATTFRLRYFENTNATAGGKTNVSWNYAIQ